MQKKQRNKGVWEVGGGRWATLYAFSLQTAYMIHNIWEHITKAMQKRQKRVDCKVGLGGQRLQQLFMLGSWEKSNEHVRKQIKRRKIRKMSWSQWGLGWQSQPEADTKGVGGQQQLLMLGYAFYLQTQHPMQSNNQPSNKKQYKVAVGPIIYLLS